MKIKVQQAVGDVPTFNTDSSLTVTKDGKLVLIGGKDKTIYSSKWCYCFACG